MNLLVLAGLLGACQPKQTSNVMPNPDDFVRVEGPDLIAPKGEKLFIKYDVEGAEEEAILGSVNTIQNNDTELLVSLYHKSRDLFSLPLLVHKLLPDHKLYLRKHPYIPAWDINLYVCKP